MGITPLPGEFYSLECVENDGLEVTFTDGKTSIRIAVAKTEDAQYYKVGVTYDFVIRPKAPHKHDD